MECTGYDATEKHQTQGIISKERIHGKGGYSADLYKDVLHYDEKPVIGKHQRIEELAQQYANDLGIIVYYAYVSSGGGCSFSAKPKGCTN
jgi:hypothetical protein